MVTIVINSIGKPFFCYKTLMKVGLSQYNGSQAVLQVFEVSEKVGPDHTSEWALCISVRSC